MKELSNGEIRWFETFPIQSSEGSSKIDLKKIIQEKNIENLVKFLKKINKKPQIIKKLTKWL